MATPKPVKHVRLHCVIRDERSKGRNFVVNLHTSTENLMKDLQRSNPEIKRVGDEFHDPQRDGYASSVIVGIDETGQPIFPNGCLTFVV